MLVAFDVGNTNIVIGVYENRRLLRSWRMETNQRKSADEYGMLLNQLFSYDGLDIRGVNDVIISTVVPSMIYTLQHLSQKYFNRQAIVVGPGIKTGLIVKYDNPKQLGSDRIVTAVAALDQYEGHLIIIDFGTATTICAVTANSEFLGGVIAPGIKISSDALFEKTAKLPRVEIESPGRTICRNTTDGIKAGLVYGNVGMVEYIVARMKKELEAYTGDGLPISVIATGGMASLMDSETDCIDHVDKLLTLTGLERIYEKNKSLHARRPKSGGNDF